MRLVIILSWQTIRSSFIDTVNRSSAHACIFIIYSMLTMSTGIVIWDIHVDSMQQFIHPSIESSARVVNHFHRITFRQLLLMFTRLTSLSFVVSLLVSCFVLSFLFFKFDFVPFIYCLKSNHAWNTSSIHELVRNDRHMSIEQLFIDTHTSRNIYFFVEHQSYMYDCRTKLTRP
jgi:hypothetical protein